MADVKVEADIVGGVIIAFIAFWIAGGWERVDCSLGNKNACAAIAKWNGDDATKDENQN